MYVATTAFGLIKILLEITNGREKADIYIVQQGLRVKIFTNIGDVRPKNKKTPLFRLRGAEALFQRKNPK